MLNIKITYKSGKVEKVSIHISDYTKALTSLVKEGRLVSFQII